MIKRFIFAAMLFGSFAFSATAQTELPKIKREKKSMENQIDTVKKQKSKDVKKHEVKAEKKAEAAMNVPQKEVGKLKKDGTPDKRFKENKMKGTGDTTKVMKLRKEAVMESKK